MTDPSQALDWVCQNEAIVKPLLIWLGGVAPIASIAAFVAAKYNALPPWAIQLLHLLGANLAHAAMGEPRPAPPASKP